MKNIEKRKTIAKNKNNAVVRKKIKRNESLVIHKKYDR